MNIAEAEHWLPGQLRAVYNESECTLIATWVLEKLTGLSRSDRLKKPSESLSDEQMLKLTGMVQRLQQHEPVQYVLAEAWFFDMPLYVDKHVLIPRPETEELVAWICDDVIASQPGAIRKQKTTADHTERLKILDIGTGSGCIALALKKKLPKAEVWGCDKSEAALNVARRNGAALDIRIDFQAVDFLDSPQWNSLPAIDILVSNPPYIPENEKYSMAANVVEHEPRTALFVPDSDALIFYKALALFGQQKLRNGGSVYVEIHEAQGEAVVQLFEKAKYENVELKQDMQGKNRMLKAILIKS
ncbi:MAG TPA: peptide chain release factor N(5)-glutamine methyltransferase [Chitinophagaceae bacterium]|nr:peptide chain release factor N(5)-glutamine methyltransferase [Chitinophagaceae bacterium]